MILCNSLRTGLPCWSRGCDNLSHVFAGYDGCVTLRELSSGARQLNYLRRAVPALLLAAAAAACTDEGVVFRDRDLFTPVPTAANGFIGYADTAAKLVV